MVKTFRDHWLLIGGVFLLGFLIGLPVDPQDVVRLWDRLRGVPPASATEYRLGLEPGHLTNPLLEVDTNASANSQEFKPLKAQVATALAAETAAGHADHVSVYFRSMNDGRWFGIDDTQAYVIASLSKIPFMMAYLKQAEADPALLQHSLTYSGEFNDNTYQNIKPTETLQAGKSYTVDDLIRHMIVYSGNNSMHLLVSNINPQYINDVFDDLKIPQVRDATQELTMSTRDFSIFFRVLYNASYLNRDMSEKALDFLSKVDFKDGLVGGVPSGVTIAHKFGERGFVAADGSIPAYQMHDCGIVYHATSPYFLCVMTQGKNLNDLEKAIQAVSKTVYTAIDKS